MSHLSLFFNRCHQNMQSKIWNMRSNLACNLNKKTTSGCGFINMIRYLICVYSALISIYRSLLRITPFEGAWVHKIRYIFVRYIIVFSINTFFVMHYIQRLIKFVFFENDYLWKWLPLSRAWFWLMFLSWFQRTYETNTKR